MTRMRLTFALFFFAATAFGNARSAVSVSGSDTNPCTVASPCRTLAAALVQTDPGGDIVVLDSAGYGTMSIAAAVTIVAARGVYAGISVPLSGIGADISASTGSVTLRGMTFASPGGSGT